jgi:hypothetical protein
MCLACELDALWYGEWERLAADGAAATGGVPPAGAQEADHPGTAAAAAARLPWSPPPAASAAEMPANPVKPALGCGFWCEETE